MRGLLAAAGYVPHWRLDREDVGKLFGKGGGRGTRAAASFDEDSTSMAVEAARRVTFDPSAVDDLWLATSSPPYLEKTNACAIHAALRLPECAGALDLTGVRSGATALRTTLSGSGTTLLVASDVRTGLPASADESRGGDAAAAVVIGSDSDGREVIAKLLGSGTATDEFTDRWRIPGAVRGRAWEERFAESLYVRLAERAWTAAVKSAGDNIDHLVVAGPHDRAVASVTKKLRPSVGNVVDTLADVVGYAGTAQPLLSLVVALDLAAPGETIALVTIADGAEVLVLRATHALRHRAASPLADQIELGRTVPYGRYLSWRGMVTVDPPNRPSLPRTSSASAYRARDWKFGLVGSRDRSSEMVHLPPARVSEKWGAIDDSDEVVLADRAGTVVSFTVDRLVYSPSPPVVFAVIDFDGGGRLPLEVTDVDPDELTIGTRVVPTFRRLHTEDEIHNYFWKVRPMWEPDAG